MIRRTWLFPLLALVLAARCGTALDPTAAPASTAVVEEDIEYTAETAILESFPVQLHTTVTMRNRSRNVADVQLESGCPVLLRVFPTEARTATIWDQGLILACAMQIQSLRLVPDETAERPPRTDAREILGDSLPNGHYFLGAYVQVVDEPVLVPAGSADLAIPR